MKGETEIFSFRTGTTCEQERLDHDESVLMLVVTGESKFFGRVGVHLAHLNQVLTREHAGLLFLDMLLEVVIVSDGLRLNLIDEDQPGLIETCDLDVNLAVHLFLQVLMETVQEHVNLVSIVSNIILIKHWMVQSMLILGIH